MIFFFDVTVCVKFVKRKNKFEMPRNILKNMLKNFIISQQNVH